MAGAGRHGAADLHGASGLGHAKSMRSPTCRSSVRPDEASHPGIPIAAVMERVAAPERSGKTGSSASPRWCPTKALSASAPRRLHDDGKTSRWLYPGFAVELFPDECKGYFLNLTSGRPAWFVSWRGRRGRPVDGARSPA